MSVRRRRPLDRESASVSGAMAGRVVLSRFRELPGAFGRLLARIGARELPLLFAVLRGRLSFVGPRALPPGTGHGHTGPRRLMAPGLTGPAQRGCGHELARRRLRRGLDAVGRRAAAGRALPEASPERVEDELVGDRLEGEQRRDQLGRRTTGAAARHTNGTRKSQIRSVSAFVKPRTRRSRARRRSRRLGAAALAARAR